VVADLPDYAPGEVVVVFRADLEDVDVARVSRAAGAAGVRRGAFGRRALITLDDGFTVEEAVRRLSGMPEVEHAQPNRYYRAFQQRLRPNDQFFRFQWHWRMLDAERVWGIQTGDPSVVVAVLDTGIAYEDFGPFRKAPDFGSTVFVQGHDFINNDTHANDDSFHGTHVASVIAEATDNTTGVAGLAFRTALMPVKVLNRAGVGSTFAIAEGLDFAAANSNVKVINLSLGGSGNDPALANAITRAVGRGITVVAATGNDGIRSVSFPAALSNVIAVGAVDGRRARASYSNFGPEVDVVAPGGDVERDDTGVDGRPDGFGDGILQQTFDPFAADAGVFTVFDYIFVDGTSAAAPHVAALAALLYRQGITDPVAIQRAIEMTATDLGSTGRDDQFGHGLINPTAALSGFGLNQR
jgi:serine protease